MDSFKPAGRRTQNLITARYWKMHCCWLWLVIMLTSCEKPNPVKLKQASNATAETVGTDITNTVATQVDSLNVVTLPGIHTYLPNAQANKRGLEFSLIKQFAEQQRYIINILVAKNETELQQALDSELADIGLIGQPPSEHQLAQYFFSTGYMDVTTQLIYRHGSGRPTAFDDLENKLILVQDLAHYHDKFAFLRSHYPGMQWQFVSQSAAELLNQLSQAKVDAVIMGSHEFRELAALYPRTRAAFDLFYPESLSLLLSQSSDPELSIKLDQFFNTALSDGTIEYLLERYQGHRDDSNPLGSMTFFRRVNHRLPYYLDIIESTARTFNLDWRLLAAIAYQESHWDPRATSPTGVRGMMMLTQKTADEMGIDNRLDLSQSLYGGAKYFRQLHKRLANDIVEPDRTWLALAAYNVGLGHIYDAQKITAFHGGNPNRWADVKQYLPLLEEKAWYQYTRHGRARGTEPVNYVQNIRQFQDLLEWRFPKSSDQQLPAQMNVKELQQILPASLNKPTPEPQA